MTNTTLNDVKIILATLNDYPVIQNMARFYVYDLSRECGSISTEWAIPANGLYECFDLKNYFEESSRKPFLIKVNQELAGFALLNKVVTSPETDWNMGEFFILAKFQDQGIGGEVAHQIWDRHPGLWEISVIPENKSALVFWNKTISRYTEDQYTKERKTLRHQKQRFIFRFATRNKSTDVDIVNHRCSNKP